MKNYLIIYQGVSIRSKNGISINRGRSCIFPKSSVIGTTHIGSNSAIGAGVQIYNKNINQNSAVSFRHPEGITI